MFVSANFFARCAAPIKPGAKKRPVRKPDSALLWDSLAGKDAWAAFRVMQDLIAAPDDPLNLLGPKLAPVPVVAADRLSALTEQLDSPQFQAREKAAAELRRLGEAARATLGQALKHQAPEVRRRAASLLE